MVKAFAMAIVGCTHCTVFSCAKKARLTKTLCMGKLLIVLVLVFVLPQPRPNHYNCFSKIGNLIRR